MVYSQKPKADRGMPPSDTAVADDSKVKQALRGMGNLADQQALVEVQRRPEVSLGSAPGMYPYSPVDLRQRVDALKKKPSHPTLTSDEIAVMWIVQGVKLNRYQAGIQLKKGNYKPLADMKAFETGIDAQFPVISKAVHAEIEDQESWLVGVVAEFLQEDFMDSAALSEDKGAGEDDKSVELNRHLVARLNGLRDALKKNFPGSETTK